MQWKTVRYFPALDGLRTVSVLLVLTAHSPGSLFRPLHGRLGVTVFFVISGFLITTLLVREEGEKGRISLRGFYLRRAFRILPLYALALVAFSLAVAADLGEHPGNYPRRLVHFVTFTNEYAGPGTFGHSWSLGVEEKFYLFWPLLAFVIPWLAVRRMWTASILLIATTALGAVSDNQLSYYSPILAGCLLALVMHDSRGLGVVARLARPIAGTVLVGLALAVLLLSDDPQVDVWFGLATAAALPAVLLGPAWLSGWLRSSPMLFVGRRSYAIYLFHPLIGSLVARVIKSDSGWRPLAYLLAMFVITLAVADVLYRVLERPLVRVGHAMSRTVRASTEPQVPSE